MNVASMPIVLLLILGIASSPAAAILPDPSGLTSYPCFQSQALSYEDATYGTVDGRAYWPVFGHCQAPQGPPAGRPLVLVFNGAGYGSNDYDYLAEHLAKNGFVVLVVASDEPSPTVSCGGPSAVCIEDRARIGVNFLRAFQSEWEWAGNVLFDTLVTIGHSRGGEAAIEAAELISVEEDTLGNPGVRAVVAMAPTDLGDDGLTGRRRLLGRDSPALLILYGSRDEQVQGPLVNPLQPPLFLPYSSGFALYDRAGREGSLEGFPISTFDQVEKSMVFVLRANHEQFSDRCGTPITCYPNVLSCDLQHQVAKGFVNAFLQWRIWGQTAYKAYVDASFDSPWTPSYPQYSAGTWSSRRVVDNFQDGELATSTMGTALTFGGSLAPTVVDNAAMDPHSMHGPEDGWRLRVSPSDASASNIVQWSIPASKKNVSGFSHLSLRVAQGFSAAGTARFKLRLRRAGSWSALVSTDSSGATIPAVDRTMHDCLIPPGGWLEHGIVHLRTIKIPLSAFGGDLTQVQNVQLRFDDPSTAGKEIFIDNVEFTGGAGLGPMP